MSRIDKFLWSVRLFKTRSLAAEACKKNRVFVNDNEIKSAKTIKINDVITIKKTGIGFKYKVLALNEKRVGAKLVDEFIIDITPLEDKEKYDVIQASQKHYRQQGEGRPTKKNRRDIEKFWD